MSHKAKTVNNFKSFKASDVLDIVIDLPDGCTSQFIKVISVLSKCMSADKMYTIDLDKLIIRVPGFDTLHLEKVTMIAEAILHGIDDLHILLRADTVTPRYCKHSEAAKAQQVVHEDEGDDLSEILRLMEANKVEIKESYTQLSKTISDNDSHYRTRLNSIESSLADISKRITPQAISVTPVSEETDSTWNPSTWGTTTQCCVAGAGVALVGGAIYFMTK